MNWGGLENFLAMGGYGMYVWGAYGMTLLSIAIELWTLARRSQRAQAEEGA